MERRFRFSQIVWFWIVATAVVSVANALVIRDPWLLSSLVRSGIGFTLLVYPVYPEAFALRWGAEKSRKIIRLLGALEILISFLVRIEYRA